jgi:hypothetical protein
MVTMEKRLSHIEKCLSELIDTLETFMAFQVKADQRFKKGQRVLFSPRAFRHGIAPAKGGAKKGRVTKVTDGFTVEVLVDGYKKSHSYFHAFWNPVH